MKRADLEARIQQAIGLVKLNMPMMVPLIVQVRISLDMRVDTACIFPSGRMLVSPFFIAPMSILELAYLLAHEVMHLYLKTAERGEAFPNDRKLVNIAHDYIINHKLTQVFSMDPPCGGLNWDRFQYALDHHELLWNNYAYFKALYDPIDKIPLEKMVIDLEEVISLATPFYNSKSSQTSSKKTAETEGTPDTAPSSPWDVLDQLNLPRGPEDSGHTEEENSEPSEKTESEETGQQTETPPQPPDGTVPDEIPDTLDDKQLEIQQRMQEEDEVKKILDLLLDDVRTEEDELAMFPDMSPAELKELSEGINKGIVQVAATKQALGNGEILAQLLMGKDATIVNKSSEAGDSAWEIGILHDAYRTPWELALQKWFDDSGPRTRSWTHASRRLGDRTDIALPGHQREGWTLNLVLDTSGSMTNELPRMLGSIEQFARAASVTTVRILQCDVNVTVDKLVEIDDLTHFVAEGGGGSDMSPAMLRLADDPTVEHVIVLTDGWIDYPSSVPYDVLWALSEEYDNFQPKYGRVIPITK